MKKTYYFQHDYNARNDPKLQALIVEMGVAGIGIYWCLVEMLYEQDGEMPMSSIKSIAYNLHVKQKTVERVIKDFGLFDYDDDKAENVEKSPKMFRNKSVLKRLSRIIDISEKRKRAIETRWKSKKNNESNEYKCNTNECDNDTNEVQKEYKSNTPIIKENDIKENDIKDITHTSCARSAREEELFQEFGQMQSAWEEIAMKFGKDIPSLKKILQDFILECRAKGTAHSSISDLRCHFVDWARIQIQQQEKQKQQNERRYKTASERKREANDIAIKRCQASIYERLTNVGGEEQLPI